jgi:hypothetical protein|tara:strand:- start:118 stop:567 length:450 start_codon:yes stop_codon:yes gene_type:complete
MVRSRQTTSTCVETEETLHKRVIQYLDSVLPPKSLYHHSPNEGNRHVNYKLKLKAMGFQSGWPDLELFLPPSEFLPGVPPAAVFIELKRKRGGRVSDNQQRIGDNLQALGCYWVVCKSVRQVHEFLATMVSLKNEAVAAAMIEAEESGD